MRASPLTAGVLLVAVLAACSTPAPAAPAVSTAITDARKLADTVKTGTKRAATARVYLTGVGIETYGHVRFTGEGADEALTENDLAGDGDPQQIEVRTSGTTVYVKGSAADLAKVGVTTPWISGRVDATDPLSKAFIEVSAQSVKLSDPTVLAAEIATGRITGGQDMPVDGELGHHYLLDLDVAADPGAFTCLLPGTSTEELRGKLAGKKVVLSAQLWLDRELRPEKFAVDPVGLQKLANPNAIPQPVITAYSEWGKPVDVAPPAADQVTDLTGLMAGH